MIKTLTALLLVVCCQLAAAGKPELLLAQVYNDTIDVKQYWVSEKLDGVRAYWDGKQLISRGGKVIAAPAWFVAGFPPRPLDGELWLGRNQFAATLSVVSKQQPVDSEWQQIRYYLFELPEAAGSFTERISAMQHLVAKQNSRYLLLVPQFRLSDKVALLAKLSELEQSGAEGLMLHHQDALYTTGRSADLLKLKTYQDSEAEVIGYRPGKGKYQGMVGALLVKTPDGKTFAIGSGLTDALRQTPPPLGAVVTYRYNGLTQHGLPRFARFLRLRQTF
ncbi:MAG: DNA ligase [Gammaproteobacteria bacterium]|nr:DNA ligase [Gammaproteobacteria bacterium]MBU1554108.1 DNA ligase [Gammaproteobacteria bacterium]MBU2072208.1 DNA ligase [Gammaproteobacteria bacterium]MBU2182070.1 DNA ligase [Gammaproteobacteria bacterium]MBU2203913.1 DNA ligase [Gammaproteobacteria bacterium]